MPKRVLVGAFTIEANTFAPGNTTLDDFRSQVWAIGDDVRRDTLGPRSELAAAWEVLERAGCELVPGLATWSAPRQPLTLDCLDEIVRLTCAPADDSIDGAYVMLHGSAAAHGNDDPEGTLLRTLRARLGPRTPIAISLDCHANLTDAMIDSVDAVAVYRTCPHIDTDRTGAASARMLVDALAGRVRPVVAWTTRPMVTPPQLHDNDVEPFRSLMRLSGELEHDDVLATGLLLVQPWIDVAALSWSAVATADSSVESARRAAETLADAAWEARHGFMLGRRLAVDAAFAEAMAGPAPFVFADSGDTTNGGSIGDSTELLRAALRNVGDASVLLSVVAPEAAAAAHTAGIGVRLRVHLGDGDKGTYNERVALDVTVDRLSDGELVYTHPVNAGYRGAAGPAALLRHGSLAIVAHTRSVGVIDPAIYVALGVDVRDYDVVQAKSHVSYRAGFDPFTPRSIVADTPGPTTGNLGLLDYRKRPRPMFPFELG